MAASRSPIIWCSLFMAFSGRTMTLKWVMRPSSPQLIMSIPLIRIPSISQANSRMAERSAYHSFR